MRILTGIDVPFQPFGGSLICADDWYSHLPESVEARFLTLPNPTGEKWWSIQDVVMMDIQKARTADGFNKYVKRLQSVVQEQVDVYQPDIIHCQHLNYGLSRAFAEIHTSAPRIGICHGTDVQTATANPFFMENLHRICDAMDMLIFPNQNMHDDFAAIYAKPKPYIINPLGIPDELIGKKHAPPQFNGTGVLRVLYAGRLLDWKGPDIAVEAMSHVQHDIHLTVIGNEDQQGYIERMKHLVSDNKLNDRVTFRHQLSRIELIEEFRKFDVIVFPSRRLEAFSLTVVEAQSQGLPVVFNPGGGIANTVGNSGVALAECTPQSLANSLDYLYEHPQVLSELQQKGYKNAANYTMSASQSNLFRASRQLIAQA